MNRKNTILIAVMINAGLLALLLVAAISSQDDLPTGSQELSVQTPQFESHPLFEEPSSGPLAESFKAPLLEIPLTEPVEPMVHKLPPVSVAPVETPLAAAPVAPSPVVHADEIIVKKGDTLEKLAKAHKTSVSDLVKTNQLSNSFLKVGQVLKIPAGRSSAKPAEKSSPEYYTMKVGENPWAIAMKHHMKVDELLKLNGLNEEKARKLKPGDRLRIR